MTLFKELFDTYNEYYVDDISTNRFPSEKFHESFLALTSKFIVSKLGKSVEGRPIYSVTIGSGPIKVLAWSQMHGNESTATRAILDILAFFNENSQLGDDADNILKKLTICIVPILNPDGTNIFQRRNALEVDLNRDARANEAPESKILVSLVKDFVPNFAFNLHDQRRFYNITATPKPSTIAFLAPAYDIEEGINESRENAMKLIASLRNDLETVIPGQVGIYSDTYSPRAFGDYVQASGASTILVESGWQQDDMEKEFVRKLNFCLLVSALNIIADEGMLDTSVDDYWQILNDERLFDMLLREVIVSKKTVNYKVDIGITRTEVSVGKTAYYSVGEISDIGDLEGWYGFKELEGKQLTALPGKVWPVDFDTYEDISTERVIELVRKGYLYVVVNQKETRNFIDKPINVVRREFSPDDKLKFEGKANFLLESADGEIKYIVLNGFLWDLDGAIPKKLNGLVH